MPGWRQVAADQRRQPCPRLFAAASARGLAKLTTGRREALPAGFLRVGQKFSRVLAALIVFNSSSIAVSFQHWGRFGTHVITARILPSLHVEYKPCRTKHYSKDGRALCTETTFKDLMTFALEGSG